MSPFTPVLSGKYSVLIKKIIARRANLAVAKTIPAPVQLPLLRDQLSALKQSRLELINKSGALTADESAHLSAIERNIAHVEWQISTLETSFNDAVNSENDRVTAANEKTLAETFADSKPLLTEIAKDFLDQHLSYFLKVAAPYALSSRADVNATKILPWFHHYARTIRKFESERISHAALDLFLEQASSGVDFLMLPEVDRITNQMRGQSQAA